MAGGALICPAPLSQPALARWGAAPARKANCTGPLANCTGPLANCTGPLGPTALPYPPAAPQAELEQCEGALAVTV
jgi:hypothetical protein